MKAFILFQLFLIPSLAIAQLASECEKNAVLEANSQVFGSKQDSQGNTYVFGKNGSNPYLVKYGECDTSVLLNDIDKLETLHGLNDSAFVSDISFGEDSSIYVTGTVEKQNSTFTYLLKLKDGDTTWSSGILIPELTYLGLTRWQYSSKVAFSLFDSCVYVANTAVKNGPNHDVLVVKFDSKGRRLKYHLQGGIVIGNGNDIASNICVKDSIIMVSCHSQVTALGYNLLTFTFDTSLNNTLWIHNEGQKNSSNTPISLNPYSNDIYLLAETKDSLVMNPKTATVIKYGVDEGKLWRKDFNLSTKSEDRPQNIFIDEYGNIAVAIISSDSHNYKRAFIVLYNSAGDHLATIEEEDSVTFFQVAIQGSCNIVSYLKREGQSVSRVRKYCNYDYAPAWTLWDSVTLSPNRIFYFDSGFTVASANTIHTGIRRWTDQTIIRPPGNIIPINKEARSIEFDWFPSVSQVQGYYVLRGLDSVNLGHIDTLSPQTTNYKDSTLAPSTRYYYQIAAFGTACDFCASAIFSDSTMFNTSLSEMQKPEFSIYPNPVSDELNIQGNLAVFEFTIYDVLGKRRLDGTNTNKIPVQSLEPGFYFLTIKTENNLSLTYKILKL